MHQGEAEVNAHFWEAEDGDLGFLAVNCKQSSELHLFRWYISSNYDSCELRRMRGQSQCRRHATPDGWLV